MAVRWNDNAGRKNIPQWKSVRVAEGAVAEVGVARGGVIQLKQVGDGAIGVGIAGIVREQFIEAHRRGLAVRRRVKKNGTH